MHTLAFPICMDLQTCLTPQCLYNSQPKHHTKRLLPRQLQISIPCMHYMSETGTTHFCPEDSHIRETHLAYSPGMTCSSRNQVLPKQVGPLITMFLSASPSWLPIHPGMVYTSTVECNPKLAADAPKCSVSCGPALHTTYITNVASDAMPIGISM